MSEFQRVSTMADLSLLNEDEVVEGYLSGLRGDKPDQTKSKSWWHGWRNGMVDKGRLPPDAASQALAKEFIEAGGWHKVFRQIH